MAFRINLQVQCSNNNVNWSFEGLLSEVDGVEIKLTLHPDISTTDNQEVQEVSASNYKDVRKTKERNQESAFVMRLTDEDLQFDDQDEKLMAVNMKFNFAEQVVDGDNEDSADDSNGRQLAIMENIRSRKMDLETAEALDTHSIAEQRNLDQDSNSHIEDRRIRDEKVREESQRKEREEKEKALLEEKLRREKVKAEAQAKLESKRAQATKAAALKAERKAEAAQRQRPTGNLIKSTATALNIEERRLRMYEELCAYNRALRMQTNMDYDVHERIIKRNIRTMRGAENSVRDKADALLKLINHPSVPQSISIEMFVDAVIAQCNKPTDNRSLYAYGQLAVLVASEVPSVMEMLIAKLNKVCIYTVPKHISYSKSEFATNEGYYRAIGFEQEDNGKMERVDHFFGRMTSCVKLYGAIVQTEVPGIQNFHGIEEGWAWLARFLNALPPNSFTSIALYSFIEVAGYAMYKRFRNQFVKVLQSTYQDFLDILPEDQKSTTVMHNFRYYLLSNQFLNEPEGRKLKTEVLSSCLLP